MFYYSTHSQQFFHIKFFLVTVLFVFKHSLLCVKGVCAAFCSKTFDLPAFVSTLGWSKLFSSLMEGVGPETITADTSWLDLVAVQKTHNNNCLTKPASYSLLIALKKVTKKWPGFFSWSLESENKLCSSFSSFHYLWTAKLVPCLHQSLGPFGPPVFIDCWQIIAPFFYHHYIDIFPLRSQRVKWWGSWMWLQYLQGSRMIIILDGKAVGRWKQGSWLHCKTGEVGTVFYYKMPWWKIDFAH